MDTRKITYIRTQITTYALGLCRSNGLDPELSAVLMDAVAGSFHQMAHEAVIGAMVEQDRDDKIDKVEQFKEALTNDHTDESN